MSTVTPVLPRPSSTAKPAPEQAAGEDFDIASIVAGYEPTDGDAHDHEHDHHHHDHDGDHSTAHKVVMVGVVTIPLIALFSAIAMTWQYGLMGWLYVGMLVGGWYLTGLGITIGFHRLLTHRSFDCPRWMRVFWMGLGSLAVEGSPMDWCMVHRKHHQFSDHHGDPHSPHLHDGGFWNAIKGFAHAHTGWLFNNNWTRSERKRYIPDLIDDPVMNMIDRQYVWWVVGSLAIPMVFAGLVTWSIQGALLGLLWGGLARVAFTHHMTWAINSICHVFGSRDFKSSDDSRNNVLFGILSHGEGWHNNHHAFPTSARHGLKWWQFDLSWVIIRTMQAVGLAWDVRLPSDKAMEKRAIK